MKEKKPGDRAKLLPQLSPQFTEQPGLRDTLSVPEESISNNNNSMAKNFVARYVNSHTKFFNKQ